MAGEVGHVVYAARLLTHLGTAVTTPAYWLGTLFPDIRHLGVVSRQRTHTKESTLQTLLGQNDFQTGMRVHAWIDRTREQFLNNHHIKEQLPWHPFVPFALNLLEDELLYDHFDDWNLIVKTLATTNPEEQHYCNSLPTIQTWHTLLQDYLQRKPTDASRRELIHAIGLSDMAAQECNTVITQLKKDARAEALLQQFWQYLEDILR